MAIEIREAKTKCELKQFVKFPFTLYKEDKFWVPPIIDDEIKALLPAYTPVFDQCRAKFWLAYKDGKAAGRIAAIINEKYNEKTGRKTGRFSRAEFIDDREVSAKLFEFAENWNRQQGMTEILGPLGFNNLDHQGMLIEGFDHLPSIASEYHKPYYKAHLENIGYEKEIDWVEFRLKVAAIPEKALKLNEMIKQRYKLKVLTFTKKDEMLPFGKKIFATLNDAFDELFSFVKFDEKHIEYYVNRYIKLLNPKFVKLIEADDKSIVGFIIGLPSLSEAFRKANGRLFPFGFIHILNAIKKPEVIDLMLTGIDPRFQSKGYSAILITELQKTLLEHGVKYAETTGIFENNHEAINHWKSYDNIQHKRKRCFRKNLVPAK